MASVHPLITCVCKHQAQSVSIPGCINRGHFQTRLNLRTKRRTTRNFGEKPASHSNDVSSHSSSSWLRFSTPQPRRRYPVFTTLALLTIKQGARARLTSNNHRDCYAREVPRENRLRNVHSGNESACETRVAQTWLGANAVGFPRLNELSNSSPVMVVPDVRKKTRKRKTCICFD